jgi:hypothetical protein
LIQDIYAGNMLQGTNRNRPVAKAEDAWQNIILHFTPLMKASAFWSHRMKMAPHPAFSPDLAPSDFYWFGKIKTAMMGVEAFGWCAGGRRHHLSS